MKKKSEFLRWFEEQYGKEPSPKISLEDLQRSFREATIAATKAEVLLLAKKRYEDRRNIALVAWCARDTKAKVVKP